MDDGSRLRDAFAQLLARGQSQAAPADALWKAQALQQGLMPPQAPPGPGGADYTGGAATPMPMPPGAPGLNFPTAPANPQNMMGGPQPKPQAPFKGRGEYALPQGPKRKKPKKKEEEAGG